MTTKTRSLPTGRQTSLEFTLEQSEGLRMTNLEGFLFFTFLALLALLAFNIGDRP